MPCRPVQVEKLRYQTAWPTTSPSSSATWQNTFGSGPKSSGPEVGLRRLHGVGLALVLGQLVHHGEDGREVAGRGGADHRASLAASSLATMTPVEALERVMHCWTAPTTRATAPGRSRGRCRWSATPTRPSSRSGPPAGTLTDLDGIGDASAADHHRGARRRDARRTSPSSSPRPGPAHAGGSRVPGPAEGRLPQPLHLERRRGVDRGHGPHGQGARARVPRASPTTRPASPSPTV